MSQRTTFSRTFTEEMQHHPLVSTYPCPRTPHGELSRHCKDFSRAERTRLLLPRLAAWIMRLVMFSLNSTTCSVTLAEPLSHVAAHFLFFSQKELFGFQQKLLVFGPKQCEQTSSGKLRQRSFLSDDHSSAVRRLSISTFSMSPVYLLLCLTGLLWLEKTFKCEAKIILLRKTNLKCHFIRQSVQRLVTAKMNM